MMKKDGKTIRLCVDYRQVNELLQLMSYPLPLIDEMLDNFEATMWFLSLDMASGFWAIPMTTRAQAISAFICPLGHFQWVRMPFGLKNAPLVYLSVIDNCLWGFKRLSLAEEVEVEPKVLQFLGLSSPDSRSASKCSRESPEAPGHEKSWKFSEDCLEAQADSREVLKMPKPLNEDPSGLPKPHSVP